MSLLVHVVRKGAPVGQFRKDQIFNLLESGRLRPDDEVFLASERRWMQLSEFSESFLKSSIGAENKEDKNSLIEEENDFEESQEKIDRGHSSRRSRRSHRDRSGSRASSKRGQKKAPLELILPGWIVALFSIIVALALGFWGLNLLKQLQIAKAREAELLEGVEKFKAQINALLESVPPGFVRGTITVEPRRGRLAVVSGATVALYQKKDVEKAVAEVASQPTPESSVTFNAWVNKFEKMLPPPVSVTVTDSNGRFDLSAPESGEYVVYSTATKSSKGKPVKMVWIQEVVVDNLPSLMVPLSEANSIQLESPVFTISKPRR